MTSYRVISQHVDLSHGDDFVVVQSFEDFDLAKAYGKTVTPDTNGSVIPNLPQSVIDEYDQDGWEYEAGIFWNGNRPAAIFAQREVAPWFK